jgi:uncharacterized protein YcfL
MKKIIIVLVALFVLVSCNNEEKNTNNEVIETDVKVVKIGEAEVVGVENIEDNSKKKTI